MTIEHPDPGLDGHGNDYEISMPSSQLWIVTYEKFGPGRLSCDEENEYWVRMGIAAQFILSLNPLGWSL